MVSDVCASVYKGPSVTGVVKSGVSDSSAHDTRDKDKMRQMQIFPCVMAKPPYIFFQHFTPIIIQLIGVLRYTIDIVGL